MADRDDEVPLSPGPVLDGETLDRLWAANEGGGAPWEVRAGAPAVGPVCPRGGGVHEFAGCFRSFMTL